MRKPISLTWEDDTVPISSTGVAERIAVIEWIGSFTIFVTLDSFDNA